MNSRAFFHGHALRYRAELPDVNDTDMIDDAWHEAWDA